MEKLQAENNQMTEKQRAERADAARKIVSGGRAK